MFPDDVISTMDIELIIAKTKIINVAECYDEWWFLL